MLATTCRFAGNIEEIIRDQLVKHATCAKVQEKLLAGQMEVAIGHVQALSSESLAPVHVVQVKPKRPFIPRARSNYSCSNTKTGLKLF